VTAANCEKHPFELADGACYDCGYDACRACLVFARGPKKPAICLDCSIQAAGVRRGAARPPKYTPKDMKVLRKRLVKALKEQRSSQKRLVDVDQITPYDPALDPSLVQPVQPAPPAETPVIETAAPEPTLDERMPTFDWSQPWSNDTDAAAYATDGGHS
jgi:hypothetical protein